jgi:hypothetical protein
MLDAGCWGYQKTHSQTQRHNSELSNITKGLYLKSHDRSLSSLQHIYFPLDTKSTQERLYPLGIRLAFSPARPARSVNDEASMNRSDYIV